MSTRDGLLSDVARERAARARSEMQSARVHAHKGSPVTPALLDINYLAQPLRDRKSLADHVGVVALATLVVKHGLLQSLVLAAQPNPPELPNPEHPRAIAEFALRHTWKPVLKDFATVVCSRAYESAASAHLAGGDPVEAGRYVRNVQAAAADAMAVAYAVLPDGAGALDTLAVRAQVALHTATRIIPKPSVIANLSVFTVDELDLCLSA